MPGQGPYVYYNRAPHLRVDNAACFITWRIAADTPDLAPAERTLIAATLTHFHPERYLLFAWVVMNDHVHALCLPQAGYSVSQLVHSWKSFCANRMQREHGRTGSVFQKDYHDHAVTSHKQLQEKAQYIVNNPFRRWPELREYVWMGWTAF